jgi:hypothetical protein
MTDYANIEVELKGVKYTTEATDSAGLLFLCILFNEDETLLFRQGRMQDALAMYSDRAASRMKTKLEAAKSPEEKQKVEDQLNDEITLELWQRIERDNTTRSLITKRIKELFRFAQPNPIPDRLVFWYSDEDNGINLSALDLLTLFSAIVGPTMADINTRTKNDNQEVAVTATPDEIASEIAPVNETSEAVQQEVLTPAKVSPVETIPAAVDVEGLQEQRAAIAKVLATNPNSEVRSALEAHVNGINAQLALNPS